jgi:hypothetical protein
LINVLHRRTSYKKKMKRGSQRPGISMRSYSSATAYEIRHKSPFWGYSFTDF